MYLMKPKTRAGINGRTTTITAVLLALALGGAATAKPVRTLTPAELRIGTYFVNPPFEYIAKGARVGFEVNLMVSVAVIGPLRERLNTTRRSTRWLFLLSIYYYKLRRDP